MPASLFKDVPTGASVSEIRPLPSDPNMRRVRIGRKTVATLRAIDLESLGIGVGTKWTASLAQRVSHALELQAARKEAMRMLGRRAYSRSEIAERLVRKKHARAIGEQIADELAADRWIDDHAYAQAVLEQVTRKRPAGKRLLLDKLRDRGIDEQLAQRTAADAKVAAGDEFQAALTLARQRLRTMGRLPAATVQRRLAGLLARRGFEEQTVAAVIDHLQLVVDNAE